MAKLIVTADDFGLSEEINEAVIRLYERGVLHRTALLVNTEHFEESVRRLFAHPGLEVGIHLNLTDGRPVLPMSDIKTLVNKASEFYGGRHYRVALMIIMGVLRPHEIHEEWRAQIAKAINAGIKVTSITSHGHVHLLPNLHRVVIDLMREFEIHHLRLIFSGRSINARILAAFSKILLGKIKKTGLKIQYPVRVIGIDHQGHLNEGIIISQLKTRGDYPAEFVIHPAYAKNRYHDSWGYDGVGEYEGFMSEKVREAMVGLCEK